MRTPRALSVCLFALLVANHTPVAVAGTNRWTPAGPTGGALRGVAVSPARPGLFYAVTGTPSAQDSPHRALFRSEDGGRSWEARSFEVPTEVLLGLVADPLEPDRLYLLGSPLLVSEDGGRSFRAMLRRGGVPFVDLVAAHTSPGALYALHGNHAVFASTDGGATWQRRAEGLPAPAAATRLLIHPENPDVLFAAGAAGVWKTTDRGLHWRATGLSLDTAELRIARSRPDTLYAYVAGPSLRRSDDGGANWAELPGTGFFSQIFSFLIHPADEDRLLARTDEAMFESRDGGQSWSEVPQGFSGWDHNPSTNLLFADPHDGERVFTGASFALASSSDFGASWTFDSRGLSHQRIWALALSPASGSQLYAVASAATSASPRLWKSRDRGFTWRFRVPEEVNTTTAVAVDPADFRHVIAAGARWNGSLRFSETHDGGATWDLFGGPDEPVWHMAFALRDPSLAFAVSFSKVYRSADGGTSWSESLQGLPEPCDTLVCSSFHIRKVIPSPHNPQTIHLLFDGGVFRSSDGGQSWEPWGSRLPGGSVWDLVADPTRPGRFYAATSLGPFLTRDGGRSWERRAAGLPERPDLPGARQVEALTLDPQAPWKLLATSFDGRVYRSRNGGFSWRLANAGLSPGLAPLGLAAHPTEPGLFYLSTSAGGLYEARFPD